MTTEHHDSSEARLKRIETTLYLLCRHLGLEPRTNERLSDIIPAASTNPPVYKR